MNSALLKTIAETENVEINTKLVNEKVNGYLQELANGTEQANASMINAAANKLQAWYRDWETDRKSTRLNSSHRSLSRMPSSA